MIDAPALNGRILGWTLFPGRLTGTLFWSITYWGDDPWNEGLTYMSSLDHPLNGDGMLMYPSRDPSDPTLFPSIRMELVREGLEDLEYLAMLRDLIEECEEKGIENQQLREAKNVILHDVARVIRVKTVERGTQGFDAYEITDNPEDISKARIKVAHSIVRLQESLR